MSDSSHPIPSGDDESLSKRLKSLLPVDRIRQNQYHRSNPTMMSGSGNPTLSDEPLSVDRINQLPEDIILHIISFLPTPRDRIIIGALAKSWRYRWIHVPDLNFNCVNLEPQDCVNLVNQTLIRRSGCKVESFRVKFRFRGEYCSNVNAWVRFVVTNEVEKFELDFFGGERYTLPQNLYTNSSFRELRFRSCDLASAITKGGKVSWNSLKKLSIANCQVSDELVEYILMGAPALEILDLLLFGGIRNLRFGNSGLKKLILGLRWDGLSEQTELEISGPNIQSLELKGHIRDCKLVDMTSLVEAAILVAIEHPPQEPTIYSLSRVHTLILKTSVVLGIVLQEKSVHFLLSKCKRLTIVIETTTLIINPNLIAMLLQNAPGIETLTVSYNIELENIEYSPSRHGYIDRYWTSRKGDSSYLRHLRIVKFDGFWDYREFAFSFVQFLLKDASVLQKMSIKLGRGRLRKWIVEMELFETWQKLFRFERSSPKAELLVYR